ncbi:hypothetical protein JW933_08985 [candidate division FCPU426 bacterium]|nr:hypothetical protein [candidate division FCPU426 bacterium]
MKKMKLGLAGVLLCLLAASCSQNIPTSPDTIPGPQSQQMSGQGILWATGDVGYVVRNSSTNLWEFRKITLGLFNTNKLLFTLPAANSGEISDLDYQPVRGFVFIQRDSNPIYQSVWTVAANGTNLQNRNIHPSAFYKRFPRWKPDGSMFAVDSNYGGQGVTLNIYNSTLAPPLVASTAGDSAVWTPTNQLVYLVLYPILHGTGKEPDRIMIANANASNPATLLIETGWPSDCSSDFHLLYVYGPDGIHGWTSYAIKSKILTNEGGPTVVRANIPINGRYPNVHFTTDERYIIFEATDGVYQMKKSGTNMKKLADGKLPVVMN